MPVSHNSFRITIDEEGVNESEELLQISQTQPDEGALQILDYLGRKASLEIIGSNYSDMFRYLPSLNCLL